MKHLASADVLFLDPDNGLGAKTAKHATPEEIREFSASVRDAI